MEQAIVVKYSRRLKRISLQRYLVSRVVFEVTQVNVEREIFALFDNQIWLEQKCLTDSDFNRKFGKSLEVLSTLLKEINLSAGISTKAILRLSGRFKTALPGFFVPKRNYPDFKHRFSRLFQVVTLAPPSEHNRKLPPKRTMGTGYRDKGTARNLAKDGSPSWQEVASRAGQEALAKNLIDKAESFKDIVNAFKILWPDEDYSRFDSAGTPEPTEATQRSNAQKRG